MTNPSDWPVFGAVAARASPNAYRGGCGGNRSLGLLYHGCDEVGDVRGATAFGGGGKADVRDGILTLPAAPAIHDPSVGALFCKPDPGPEDLRAIAGSFAAQPPAAETCLDKIAKEPRTEASLFARDPVPLWALVAQTPAPQSLIALQDEFANIARSASEWRRDISFTNPWICARRNRQPSTTRRLPFRGFVRFRTRRAHREERWALVACASDR
jgi:hypothetical protein